MDVAVVLEALGIEARGRGSLEALCPYHDDKSAGSFRVAARGRRKGWFHCFSCGKSGDLLSLVIHVRKISIAPVFDETEDEAIASARKRARAWVRSLGAEEKAPEIIRMVVPTFRQRYFRLPLEVTVEPLEKWPTSIRRYVEGRGLTAEQVERWGIGYAIDGKDLGGRVVLVVRDATGRPVNYHARTFGDDPKRYKYPKLSDLPKLDVLFGEQHWPKIDHRREVVVFEGGFNALAFERAFPEKHVAAIGGSDIRPGHLRRLATFSRVVIATDDDRAGNLAADEIAAGLARAYVAGDALPKVVEVERAKPPKGPDVDEMGCARVRAWLAPYLR